MGKFCERRLPTEQINMAKKAKSGTKSGQHEGNAMAITTKFSYGPTGRQDVAQQDGQLGGKLFVITYSDDHGGPTA
jgi:hypothetical protein